MLRRLKIFQRKAYYLIKIVNNRKTFFGIIIISLSCHEQVCLSGLRFERYFSHHRAMMGEVSLEM